MQNDTDIYTILGKRIRAKRGSKMTQEQLSTKVGLTRTSITNIELGRQKIMLHQLMSVARELGVSMESLLVGLESIKNERREENTKPERSLPKEVISFVDTIAPTSSD